jgi:hypothetical protein
MPTLPSSGFHPWSCGLSLIRRTAVCGPACTVVWQGRRGDPSPYADCCRSDWPMPVHRRRRIFVLRNCATRSAGRHGRSDGPRCVGGSGVSGLVVENGAALVRDRVARRLSAVCVDRVDTQRSSEWSVHISSVNFREAPLLEGLPSTPVHWTTRRQDAALAFSLCASRVIVMCDSPLASSSFRIEVA